jgi:hypothetical protein
VTPDDERTASEPTPAAEEPPECGGEAGRPSQATELVRLARNAYALHVSPDGEPFALPDGGPPVARMLRGQRGSLRADLAAAYYDRTGRAASASGLADALTVIDGLAVRTDPAVPLNLRCAEHDDALWLDLGRADGRAVRITADGWTLHTGSGGPVWRRTALTGELPEPEPGGRLEDLWELLNVGAGAHPRRDRRAGHRQVLRHPGPRLAGRPRPGAAADRATGPAGLDRRRLRLPDRGTRQRVRDAAVAVRRVVPCGDGGGVGAAGAVHR